MSSVILTTPEELRALIRSAVEEAIEERDRSKNPRSSGAAATDWIKAEDAATILGVTRGYLRHMKNVPSHGKGRQRRWKRSELEAHMAARGKAA